MSRYKQVLLVLVVFILSGCSLTHRTALTSDFRQPGTKINLYVVSPQQGMELKENGRTELFPVLFVAGIAAGILIIPLAISQHSPEELEFLEPMNQAFDNELFRIKLHDELIESVGAIDWITLNSSAIITEQNSQLLNINSRTNDNPKVEQHSLIVSAVYSLSRDFKTLEFNTTVTLNSVNKRGNKKNKNKVLYKNSFRYISASKFLVPRTAEESIAAKESIEKWYEEEYAKLGTRMTSKRREKLDGLKKIRNRRLKEKVGERSDKAKIEEIVKLWTSGGANGVGTILSDALEQVSKMIIMDMSDSRSFKELKYDESLKSLDGGAKLVSNDGDRILVRTFGVGTEGRLCMLPKKQDLKYCTRD